LSSQKPQKRERIEMYFAHQQRQLVALADLVADIGEPCWASGNTAAALRAFDGFDLRPPFHILTTRDRTSAESDT